MSDTQVMQKLIAEIVRRRNVLEQRLETRDTVNVLCTQAILDELNSILSFKNELFN